MISYTRLYAQQELSNSPADPAEMKMVIVIRRDLRMGRGKEIAQGSHAAMGAYNDSMNKWGPIAGDMVEPWTERGKKKVVLRVNSEDELLDLANRAYGLFIGHYLVRDAGRTEVEPGTPTALAIGPDQSARIDKITGHLDLY